MGEMGEMIRDEPRSAGWAEIDEIAFREWDGLAEDLSRVETARRHMGQAPAARAAALQPSQNLKWPHARACVRSCCEGSDDMVVST